MPVDKIVRTFVQPPLGLNKRASALTLSPDSAIENVNVDYQETLEGDIITQRPGVSMAPGPIWSDGVSNGIGSLDTPPNLGIFTYNQVDTDTGARNGEILAVSSGLHRVVDKDITISYTGAGTASISLVPHPSTPNRMLMTLTDTDDVSAPYAWTLTGGETLYGLKVNYIDTTANFSIDIGKIGYVNGTVTTSIEITADNGSGGNQPFAVGEEICKAHATSANSPAWLVTKAANDRFFIAGVPTSYANNDVLTESWANRITTRCLSYLQTTTITPSDSYVFTASYTRPIFGPTYDKTELWNSTQTVAREAESWRSFNAVNMNGCLFIANPSSLVGSDERRLLKYDGRDVYQAGLPKPVIDVIAEPGSGATDAGLRRYQVSYVYTDNKGNEIESELSDAVEFTIASAARISITLTPPSILNFMTKESSYDGITLTGVNTVTLFDNYLQYIPGDVIYFKDSSVANYWEGWVSRTITSCISRPSGQDEITFDGDPVDIIDSHVFSVGKVRIYRNKLGGTEMYLSGEVNYTSVMYDNVSDATLLTLAAAGGPLGVRYIAPEANQERTLLEDGPRYLVDFRGSLLCSGFSSKPIEVACSVPGSPEYFPATLKFNVGNDGNDIITGMRVLGQSVIIGKENSIHVVTGEVLTAATGLPSLRVDLLSENLGVASNDAMIIIDNSLFFLSKEDVYMLTEGGRPQSIGGAIKPYLQNRMNEENTRLQFRRARMGYHPLERRLFVWIPVEDRPSSSEPNSSSILLSLDMERNTWQKWEGVYMDQAAFWFSEKESFLFNSRYDAAPTGLRKFRNEDPVFDTYDELNEAIDFELQTGFDNLGKITSQKKFQTSKIWSTQGSEAPDFTLNVSTYTNYDDQTVRTSLPLTFDANSRRGIVPLIPERSEGLAYKFTHSTAGEKVKLLGWEHEVIVDAMEKLEPKRRG